MQAIWNNAVIAESSDVVEIDGATYFPVSSLKRKYIKESSTRSFCPTKGYAKYFHLQVGGEVNENAGWYYDKPGEMAFFLKNRVAFWKGVIVKEKEIKIKKELLSMLNTFI